jgi:ectoine hydroxylase-related dioxygenase (phytanoyl-CoA dioxygenase family)
MTTVPLGYLIGVWVALEDIHPGNGPLTYYPGSHKLPYILNSDYNNTSNAFVLDGKANEKFERKVREVIQRSQLKEHQLEAKAGDVFLWHANLLHGGARIIDKGSTRKSMVSHYFAEGVLCFHEISERPAIIRQSS